MSRISKEKEGVNLNLGMETEVLEFKKSTGELKKAIKIE